MKVKGTVEAFYK